MTLEEIYLKTKKEGYKKLGSQNFSKTCKPYIACIITAWVAQILWNYIVPLWNQPKLDIIQAGALLVLLRILGIFFLGK